MGPVMVTCATRASMSALRWLVLPVLMIVVMWLAISVSVVGLGLVGWLSRV